NTRIVAVNHPQRSIAPAFDLKKAGAIERCGWLTATMRVFIGFQHDSSSMTAIMAYSYISQTSGTLGVCAIIAIIRPAHADPRAVVELFTSQGCSSCPPADRIIGELAKDPSVIALSMPIDYWDYLGWKDTLADARFSARQKAYSQMRGDRDVYTPQVIVNGSAHLIGSDRAGIEGAIGDTKKSDGVMTVPVSMMLAGKQI